MHSFCLSELDEIPLLRYYSNLSDKSVEDFSSSR